MIRQEFVDKYAAVEMHFAGAEEERAATEEFERNLDAMMARSEFDDPQWLRTIVAGLVGTFRQVHGGQIDGGKIHRFSADVFLTSAEIQVLEAFLEGRKVE